jgi:hypothetical protein
MAGIAQLRDKARQAVANNERIDMGRDTLHQGVTFATGYDAQALKSNATRGRIDGATGGPYAPAAR